jgi:hypothetical protein
MKYPKNICPPVTRFERQTGCCPLIMATMIVDQLRNHFWTELPDDLADEVATKAEIVFAGNARWRRRFKGRHGREYLLMLLRHWLSSALFKRKSPLFCELPGDFKMGKPLPLQPHPWPGGQKHSLHRIRQTNRRKSPSSRAATHFAHGCELLAP